LDSVTIGGNTYSYKYDAQGRPATRFINGSLAQRLLWDGDHILAQLDSSNHRTIDYSYEPGIDAPLSANVDDGLGGVYPEYFVRDALGNVLGRMMPSGSVTEDITYDAWGQITSGSSDGLAWKGLFYDSNTGLYYMRARWYDPETGRFMSEDPIGLSGGINMYAFAGDDPVNGRDPSADAGSFFRFRITKTASSSPGKVRTRSSCLPSAERVSARVADTSSQDSHLSCNRGSRRSGAAIGTPAD
jgi:RHS repeat-associated protein